MGRGYNRTLAAAAMSKSACVVPFTTLDISADGTPLVCCQVPVALTVGGRPASVARDSLDAIWNAPELLSLRAAMAGGEKADVCRICWEHESVAPLSLRQVMNEGVHAAMGAQWSLIKLMRESAKTGFH
ncbi:MAG: SPASM domain-containing protein, partial [Acidimicrobiia bacterium]